jgi:hypothetical protein
MHARTAPYFAYVLRRQMAQTPLIIPGNKNYILNRKNLIRKVERYALF